MGFQSTFGEYWSALATGLAETSAVAKEAIKINPKPYNRAPRHITALLMPYNRAPHILL